LLSKRALARHDAEVSGGLVAAAALHGAAAMGSVGMDAGVFCMGESPKVGVHGNMNIEKGFFLRDTRSSWRVIDQIRKQGITPMEVCNPVNPDSIQSCPVSSRPQICGLVALLVCPTALARTVLRSFVVEVFTDNDRIS
jgi:predicted peroxiredoxin